MQKYWIAKMMFGGGRIEVGIGSAHEISLKEARDANGALRVSARNGIDPRNRKVIADPQGVPTFAEAVDLYLREKLKEFRNEKHVQQWQNVTSAVAGQTSREIAPNNDTADLIASMIGGVGGSMTAARLGTKVGKAPTMDDLRSRQSEAYGAVDSSQARLSAAERQGLLDQMRGRTNAMDMDEFMHPRANRTMERMNSLEPAPRIADVEKKRRLVGRDVAGSLDPSEAAIGQGMKDEIDTYLKNLAGSGNLGDDASATLSHLQQGRELTSRIKKAEAITGAVTKAGRRAASSDTGGNAVNTTRQNIRAMLDDPKKSRGYNPAERAQMESIVRGTPSINMGRMLGRLSPSAGDLPMMGNMAAMAGGAMGGPSGFMLGAVPGVVGMVAKRTAEGATKRQIRRLLDTVQNGGPLPVKGIKGTDKRAIVAAMLANSMQSQPQ